MGRAVRWWLPIRFLTPAAFLIAAAVAALIFEASMRTGLDEWIVSGVAADLREDAFRTANVLAEQLEEGKSSNVQRTVELWALKQGAVAAVLLGPDGRPVAATRRAWLHGRHDALLGDLLAFATPLLRAGQQARPRVARLGRHRIAVAMPVRFPAAGLGPKPQGVFAAVRDFADDEARALQLVRRSVVDFLFWMITMAVLGWMAVHFGVEKRIRRIIAAARRVAQGRFGTRSGVHGSDEIGELGSAFDAMSLDLARVHRQLLEAREALEHMAEAVMITDAEGRILYVNPAFERMTGYPLEEALGATPRILKSGKMKPAFYARLWQTIADGRVWEGRVVNRRKDGSLYTALETIAPVRDATGRIVRFVAVLQDVTELERLQRRLADARRNEALATLVGGIAHDFNNILAGITGNLYLLGMHADDTRSRELVGRIQKLAERGALLVRQMMTFARQDAVRMQRLDLASFLREAVRTLEDALPPNARPSLKIEAASLPIVGEPGQIREVLAALLRNARDAVEGVPQPRIRVRARAFAPDEDFRRRHPEAEAPRWAMVEVADNGAGMDEKTRERAFDPFFTTKEVGKGTGLGLAMVLGAMRRHGGIVELDSAPGEGTVVRLFFPLAEDAAAGAGDEAAADAPGGRGERVLIAEDEPAVREVLVEILQEHGYRPQAFESGAAAAAAFTRDPERWAAAVLDVVMPEMNGVDAARVMRERRPELPILFVTGHDQGTLPPDFASDARTRLLFKPVQTEEILKALAALLRG